MIDINDYVYPVIILDLSEHFGSGLTKRELFAAMAMQGLYANTDYSGNTVHDITSICLAAADSLIEELNK